jgi:hypothetical protein
MNASDNTATQIKRLADQWTKEFCLGYRFGFRGKANPPCDKADYPPEFHAWPLDRRNAWWCEFNQGLVEKHDRARGTRTLRLRLCACPCGAGPP